MTSHEQIFQSARQGIFQADTSLRITEFNPMMAEILGLEAVAIQNSSIADFVDDKMLAGLRKSLEGEFVTYEEYSTLTKQSSPRLFRLNSGPIRNSGSVVTGIFCIVDVFGPGNDSIESLFQVGSRLRSLAEASEDKILLLDVNGIVKDFYGKWHEKIGIPSDNLIGHPHHDLYGQAGSEAHKQAFAKALTGEFVIYEWAITHGSDTTNMQEAISPIRGVNGEIVGLLAVGRDVTILKKIEDALNHKAQQLESLYNAGRLLGRTLNLEQNHEALFQSLRKTIPCDGFFISTYNPAQNIIRCQAAWMDGVQVDTTAFPELPLEEEGHGTQSLVIRLGESIILNDYEATLRSAQSVHHVNPEGAMREEIPSDEDRARSAMIIPLKLEQEVIGVLQIFSYKLNDFTDEHLMLAEAMASHGAAAQNNSLLYKMAEDEVIERTRAEQLRNALYRISQTVHSSDSLDDILNDIYSIISEVLPASSFYFAFLDQENGILTFPYFNDDYDIRPEDRVPGQGLTEYVLRQGETYLWRASQPDPTEGGQIEVLGKDAAVWLGVPLMEKGKAIGVMAVQNYHNENAYGDREQEILDFVAAEVARAIVAMRAVKSIRESEDKYRSLIENTREGIFLWSVDRLEVVNQPFCDLFGYSAETLCSREFDLKQLIAESQRSKIVELVTKYQHGTIPQPQMELVMLSADGREFEAEVSTNTITYKDKLAIQGIVRDISQRRHIEAQLLQTAKLEAIGRLAGGVAHDFNNLLTALSGTAELMLLKMAPDNTNYEDLEQILTIARRGSNLTQQLLAFARSQPQQPKVFQLNSIVEGTQQMLRRLIGDTMKLSLKVDPLLPTVKADPAQLEMALMNLIVNSRDAMTTGGEITIATSLDVINEDNSGNYPGIEQGSYVVLTVSDQGVGMPKEVLDRATDPFFTTKPIGKGTGLGLSTVHGIARQSGGVLKISSEVGLGTTVQLFLPVSGEAIIADVSVTTVGDSTEGKETILVCDDEDSVRQVAVRLLRTKGYNVLEATEGQHALDVAAVYDGKIDMLLTDMAMPVMGGPELAHHLKEKRPGLKVIMMSGYSPMAFPSDYDFEEPQHFIQKPFRAHQLTSKVREILNRPDGEIEKTT